MNRRSGRSSLNQVCTIARGWLTVAQVVFDPRVEGVVDRFDVVSREDTAVDEGRIRRVAQLDAVVRSRGATSHRTIFVTLEQAGTSRWMITAYR